MDRRKGRKIWLWALAALALAAALLVWRHGDRTFTPEGWAAADLSRRGLMVESLLEQYDGLVGMTYEQVTGLLGTDLEGEQTEERFLPTGGRELTQMLVYPAGGKTVFPGYLCVYLKDGVVTRARLVSD